MKTTEIRFIEVNASHITSLSELARSIWSETYAEILSQVQIDYMLERMYNKEKIQQELTEGHLWYVLCIDKQLEGFVSYKAKEDKVYLSKIYLKKQTHSRGLGKQMLDKVIDYAKDQSKQSVYLNVNKENGRAIRFYERNGFVKISSEVNDIGGGFVMDDFVYELKLSKEN